MNLKSILSLALVLMTTLAFSQTNNLRRAKASYNKFSDVKSIGNPMLGVADLKSAHAALEKAIEHEKTKDLAETWTYYALTNADLALMEEGDAGKEFLATAIDARQKATQLDTDGEQAENLSMLSSLLAQYELNIGVNAWDQQDFATAYGAFDRGSQYLPGDTTLLYYAGLAAVHSQNYNNAIAKYTELVPIDEFSSNREIILDLSRIYLMQGDTTNAIKYAEIGSNKYPQDGELATQFIELNLMAGNEKEIIQTITDQAARSPQDKNLQYYLGIAYSAANDLEKAEVAYEKALAIDPNFVDALINMGGLVLNKGIDKWNKTNNNRELSQQEYDAEIQVAHSIFDEALPYLQKAVDIDSSNYIALSNLQKYYQIKENQEKVDELQAKLDALN